MFKVKFDKSASYYFDGELFSNGHYAFHVKRMLCRDRKAIQFPKEFQAMIDSGTAFRYDGIRQVTELGCSAKIAGCSSTYNDTAVIPAEVSRFSVLAPVYPSNIAYTAVTAGERIEWMDGKYAPLCENRNVFILPETGRPFIVKSENGDFMAAVMPVRDNGDLAGEIKRMAALL